MQIRDPSDVQLMLATVDFFLSLVISSYQDPLYSIHTMITPSVSEEVSFCCASFQVTTRTDSLCPSRVWFIDKLETAASPPLLCPFGVAGDGHKVMIGAVYGIKNGLCYEIYLDTWK